MTYKHSLVNYYELLKTVKMYRNLDITHFLEYSKKEP